jgi:hypothetical protein
LGGGVVNNFLAKSGNIKHLSFFLVTIFAWHLHKYVCLA